MKKYIILLTVGLLLFGCSEDFLDRYPTTKSVIESFYSTPDDGTEALTAAYNMLLRDDWWSPILYSEIQSDLCAGGAGSGDGGGFQRLDRALQWPGGLAHQEAWETYFGGIARANLYLEYESLIDWSGKEAMQLQYQAEARFLRAYYHFILTRLFGLIPIVDHQLADELLPRSSAEDLFTFILDDLAFCAEHGLAAPYASIQEENWGRANKWAGMALFARVYLYYSGYYNSPTAGDYTAATAREYVDNIIDNSGYGLVNDFASLWRVPAISELSTDLSLSGYAGEINQEVIWSIRYTYSPSYGDNHWQRLVGPRGFNIDPYGNGWGGMTVLPEFWNSFEAGDTRKTATILSFPDHPELSYDYVTQQQAQYTGYSYKKYEIVSIDSIPEPSPNWQFDGFEDFIVLRFADVLLMGAELHLNGGNTGTAVQYLNMVRDRAFGDNTHNISGITVENVMNERKHELAGEGVWYYDLLRSVKGDFSKLADLLTYVDENDDGDYSQTPDVTSLDVDGNNFVATRGLLQIPQFELDLMEGAIEQNPGYE